MSFTTDAPLFPYREPVTRQRGAWRLLRVFFLADGFVNATHCRGVSGRPGAIVALPVAWADRLPESARGHLARQLKLPGALPYTNVRTEFEVEHGSRDGCGDVRFEPNPDGGRIRLGVPVVESGGGAIQAAAVCVALGFLVLAWFRRVRRGA